ncbi:39353_t:CDS:2, partial [Gigaspora margarita]
FAIPSSIIITNYSVISQPSDYYEGYEKEDSISSTTIENNIADETINKSFQKTLPPIAEFRKQGSCKVEVIDKKAPRSHKITKNIKFLNPQALVQSKIEYLFWHSVDKHIAQIEQIEKSIS